MAPTASQWMILIAGPVRSGKSTLARRIADRFGGIHVSFGEAVRQRTQVMGLPDQRGFWQRVGEEWVAKDPQGLCDVVLGSTAGNALVVVDGVRHRRVHDLLQANAESRRVVMVFVGADLSVRHDRLASDGLSDEAISRVLSHSTEAELSWLRGRADIVADGTGDASEVLGALEILIAGGYGQNSL
jgi:cytidylate kinase